MIQDRSFNADGSLFYPANRAFFEGHTAEPAEDPLRRRSPTIPSDIAAIWNPEAFFNVMVVNGVSWPTLEVEPDLYRFRLLNGCNSRFLNLSLQALNAAGAVLGEVPFYQIGAEQSLLPNVVKIETGFRTVLPGGGGAGTPTPAAFPEEALLMGLAERADIIVDFSNLPAGTTRVRMINTAPDAPFGGFPDIPADPGTTGQVMEFVLVADTAGWGGLHRAREPGAEPAGCGRPGQRPRHSRSARDLALIEEESILVCATVRPNGAGQLRQERDARSAQPRYLCRHEWQAGANSVPFAPKAAVLGINGAGGGTVTLWSDPIVTNPALGDTETWELWNWTVDGHPIHLHLVKFKVVEPRGLRSADRCAVWRRQPGRGHRGRLEGHGDRLPG